MSNLKEGIIRVRARYWEDIKIASTAQLTLEHGAGVMFHLYLADQELSLEDGLREDEAFLMGVVRFNGSSIWQFQQAVVGEIVFDSKDDIGRHGVAMQRCWDWAAEWIAIKT